MSAWSSRLRWLLRAVLVLMVVAAVTLIYLMHRRKTPGYLAARVEEAVAAGDDATAEIYLRNLIRAAPEDADAKLALADLFVRRAVRAGYIPSYGVDGRALQLLAEAAALKPGYTDLQIKLMMAYLESGRAPAAEAIAKKLVKGGSENELVLYVVARVAMEKHNFKEAKDPLDRLAAVQSDPSLEVLLLQAQLNSQFGEKARLMEIAEKAEKTAEKHPERLTPANRKMLGAILALRILKAEGPEEADRYTLRALALFEKMIRSADAPDKAAWVRGAAEIVALAAQAHPLQAPAPANVLKGRQEIALQFARLARPLLTQGELGPRTYYILAEAEFVEGRQSAGMKLLEQGLEKGQKLPSARILELVPLHLAAAQRLISQRRFAEAEPHCQWLLENKASAAWGHRLAGQCAWNEGRLEEAVGHWAAALPQFDESIELHAAQAAACLFLERWEAAARELQILLARSEKMKGVDRAAVREFLGPVEKLPLLLGKARLMLKHDADVPPLIKKLAEAHQEAAALQLQVEYHVRRGEFEQADRYLQEGRTKYPGNFSLVLTEIQTIKRKSGENEAIARLQRFVEDNPKHLGARAMLAEWRVARGEDDAAVALADTAARRFPDDSGVKLLGADVRLAAGKLDEALPILEELRASDAPKKAVALLQARAALMGRRIDAAAAALEQTGTGFQQSGLGKLWMGQLYSAQGNLEQAVTDFSDSFRVSAVRPMARQALFQAFLGLLEQNQDLPAVEAKVKQLLAEYPQETFLLVIAAELAARQGRFPQALNLLDRANHLQPDLPFLLQAKARILLRMDQPARALTEVERALRIVPRDVPALLLAVQAHLAHNDPEAALKSVEQALAEQPELVESHLARAEILRRLDRSDEAVLELQDLLRRRPQVPPAYLLLAEIHEQEHREAQALEVLRAGLQQFPAQLPLCQKEITVLCRLGRTAEAEEAAGQMAGEKPDADLCLALGAGFLSGDELAGARRWAEQGLNLADKPRQTSARLLMANISLAQGRRTKDKTLMAESRDFYRQVFANQPENLLAANNLAWLLAEEFDQPDQARQVVDEALRKTSLKRLPASVADTFAMVYRKTGRLDGAQQIIDEALRQSPDLAVLNFQAGLIYGQKHRLETARSALQKALDLGLSEDQAVQAEAELQRLEALKTTKK
ncbi:MAG: tetratricopeptide repeat protein [Pirellulales bacterium]|nr:tetratricopeptide repeat protein [Pirellulales bacterium]